MENGEVRRGENRNRMRVPLWEVEKDSREEEEEGNRRRRSRM